VISIGHYCDVLRFELGSFLSVLSAHGNGVLFSLFFGILNTPSRTLEVGEIDTLLLHTAAWIGMLVGMHPPTTRILHDTRKRLARGRDSKQNAAGY
jgi:hypothetical protein